MLIATGSQGERRAATAQLSRGKYLGHFELKEGDTFLFSSRTIPGNERDVIRIWNAAVGEGRQGGGRPWRDSTTSRAMPTALTSRRCTIWCSRRS
jgi:hypothetical protein